MHTFLIAFRTALVAAACALLAAGCGSDGNTSSTSDAGADHDTRLSLVSYSTPREVFPKLIDAFTATSTGTSVSVDQSYGASGDQSRAVESGLPADVVSFSLEPDMTRLVDSGAVSSDWNTGPTKGMVTNSVVVFVVRAGNPKKIATWDDLLAKDVEVVTPNPFTSGGARWNLMAAYGAWRRAGDSDADALDKLATLLKHTPVQSKSAREALQVFTQGKGDVMLAYENEALLAKKQGQDVDIVMPDSTILIENPIAVTTASKHPAQAKAFVQFLLSTPGQTIYAKNGYRPVDAKVMTTFGRDFPVPEHLFTIADLGGWASVMKEFFDRSSGKVTRIEQGLGVGTDG